MTHCIINCFWHCAVVSIYLGKGTASIVGILLIYHANIQYRIISCQYRPPLHWGCLTAEFTPSSLGNLVCLPAERPQCRLILPVRHIRAFLKSGTILLWWQHSASLHLRRSVNFKGKKKIADSVLHTAFGWNGWTHGQFLQAKNWVLMSLHCHRPPRACSVAGIIHMREVTSHRGWCNSRKRKFLNPWEGNS